MTDIPTIAQKFSALGIEVESTQTKRLYYKKYTGKIVVETIKLDWRSRKRLVWYSYVLSAQDITKKFTCDTRKRHEGNSTAFFFEDLKFLDELHAFIQKNIPVSEITKVYIEWSDTHDYNNFVRMPQIYKKGYRFKINFNQGAEWYKTKDKVAAFLKDRKTQYKANIRKYKSMPGFHVGSYFYTKTEKDLVFFQFAFPTLVGKVERVVE